MSLRSTVTKFIRHLEKGYETYNTIEVSRSALIHNIEFFESQTHKQVIPVLKGNAYGHDTRLVARALKSQDLPYIAVDGYFEALRVREISKQAVLVMGAILPSNFRRMRYDNFTFVVQNEATIRALGETGKKIKVHLECNTGMNRYGAGLDEVVGLTRLILCFKNLELEGVMSHLADSDGDDPSTVDAAVDLFDRAVEKIMAVGARPTMIHVAQSAGSLKAKSKYANTIRLGISTYGINPFPVGHELYATLRKGLRPALKLTSTITKVIELEKGDKVSYNYTFTAPKRMKIGVMPLGYYEGVNRALSNKGTVTIASREAPMVGRICMNHTIINLDGIDAKQGDTVVVYSNNPEDKNAIDTIARDHNLFNYNLLTSLSQDVRRTLVD